MPHRVLCLRPEADFTRVDAAAPKALEVSYRGPADADVPSLMKASDALVIPAVGPKLASELFDGTKLKLVQVTGAGLDRLDQAALTKLGIPVANVPGGSNSAVAEYAVTAASMLLRASPGPMPSSRPATTPSSAAAWWRTILPVSKV